MQKHLHKYFQIESHKGFLNEASVIDKTDGKDPRKKRERYWMRTLKTMEPYGLDIADSVLQCLVGSCFISFAY